LVTTFTQRNAQEIREHLIREHGSPPSQIHVRSWYEFLLREAIKPYQAILFSPNEIRSINFEHKHPRYAKRQQYRGYYLGSGSDTYSDVAADLACSLIEKSGGQVLRRLEEMYDAVYIDEMQDLAGFDLTFVEHLMRSAINVCAVGDPRQATYATNRSSKNSQYRKIGLYQWAEQRKRAGQARLVEHNHSYRRCQLLCCIADRLYPELPPTESRSKSETAHDGVFAVREEDVSEYVRTFEPELLRWDRRSHGPDKLGLRATNIGVVKGCTFDRVLVFPTRPMKKFLKTLNASDAGDRSKLYVAITRARHSAVFVLSRRESSSSLVPLWEPCG
jgi:hypothetical protein